MFLNRNLSHGCDKLLCGGKKVRYESLGCCLLSSVAGDHRGQDGWRRNKTSSPEADRHRAFWRVNNAGSVTHKWDLSTPLERRKLKKLNILQWVPSGLHSVPATAKQTCLYKLVNGEKYIWSVWHLKMINERASDRINFLSFYVSLASGSTCSLAATRYLDICHWSWPSASAGLKGLLHQTQGCITVCNASRKNWGCQGLGQKLHQTCTLAPVTTWSIIRKLMCNVQSQPCSWLFALRPAPLLTTAARLLTPWGWRSNWSISWSLPPGRVNQPLHWKGSSKKWIK